MLTLHVVNYPNTKSTTLTFKGEGTVMISQIFKDNELEVAKIIKFYEPDKVTFNDVNFENSVLNLRKKMY